MPIYLGRDPRGGDDGRGVTHVSEYAKTLGARLRTIRQQQGLSLHGVEQKSQGRWKAVVVGSYERGDRAITVQRMAELARFYGVPMTELLPESEARIGQTPPARVVLDLERMSSLPREQAGPMIRFASAIQSARGDYNGRVLTVRRDDLMTLAVLYDEPVPLVVERLINLGVLAGEVREGLRAALNLEPARARVGA